MDEKQDVVEIDLLKLFQLLWRRIWLILLAAAVAGGIALAGTYYLITPTYQSSAMMYVNNSSVSVGSASFSISSSELSAAKTLVDTYIVILKSRSTLEDVIQQAELPYNYEELSKMISAAAVNSTEVFQIVITSTSPQEAERIANTIAVILPDKIANIVDGSSVRIVDYAVVPAERYAPSYSKNTLIGALIGVVFSVAAIVIGEMYDRFVRSEDYLSQTYQVPLLATVPDMRSPIGKGYYEKYYKSEKKVKRKHARKNKTAPAKNG